MSGHDQHDASSLQEDAQDFTANLTGTLPKGLRVGVLQEALESDGVDAQIKEHFSGAISSLEKMEQPLSMYHCQI